MNDEIRADDILLTPQAVAARFGVHLQTLDNWRFRGQGPAYTRIGRRVRYTERAVLAWLNKAVVPSAAA